LAAFFFAFFFATKHHPLSRVLQTPGKAHHILGSGTALLPYSEPHVKRKIALSYIFPACLTILLLVKGYGLRRNRPGILAHSFSLRYLCVAWKYPAKTAATDRVGTGRPRNLDENPSAHIVRSDERRQPPMPRDPSQERRQSQRVHPHLIVYDPSSALLSSCRSTARRQRRYVDGYNEETRYECCV